MEETLIIPHRELDAVALRAVIEEFVTREGTDYGLHEHSLEQKHDAVARQLEAGEAFIIFDPASEAVTLVRREDLPPGVNP